MGVPASDSRELPLRKHLMAVAKSSWSRIHEAHLMLEADDDDYLTFDSNLNETISFVLNVLFLSSETSSPAS